MEFEPQATLTEQIADHLGGEIIAGRLAPASRIQELKVAGELGVSRGSVREALLILESRHLIEIIPRRGAVVSSMESNEIADFCEVFSQMQSLCFVKLAGLTRPDLSGLSDALATMSDAVRAGDIPKDKCDDLGIIVSVWLNPGIVDVKDLDHQVLFDIHRKATTQAIHKAMNFEPSIDWLLENQDKVVHKYFEQVKELRCSFLYLVVVPL